MTTTEKWPGRIALMVAHCAGMVDLVALPVWVGTLIRPISSIPSRRERWRPCFWWERS